MTFFTPKVHYNTNVQAITVPNKNVQSYFMKSETSHFVKENERITDPTDIITLVLTTTEIILQTDKISILTSNKQRFDGLAVEGYDIEITEDITFFKTLFLASNFNPRWKSLEHAINYLQCKLVSFSGIKWRNRLVNLVFDDLFTRSEILGMINMFIKYMCVKGIMITPYSLVVCFGINTSSASVFVKSDEYISVGFVDDYTYLYGNRITKGIKGCGIECRKGSDKINEYERENVKIESEVHNNELGNNCSQKTDEKNAVHNSELEDGNEQAIKQKRPAHNGDYLSEEYWNEEQSEMMCENTLKEKEIQRGGNSHPNTCLNESNDTCNSGSSQLLFTYDSIDFAEEFARQSVGIGKKTYYCNLCDYKTECVDTITDHIKTSHGNELSEDYEDVINDFYTEKKEDIKLTNEEPEINYFDILRFIGGEKEKKLAINKVFIGIDNAERFKTDDDKTVVCDRLAVLNGAWAFLSIESSKEMWMSDKEWMAAGLRILKEKLLFYI